MDSDHSFLSFYEDAPCGLMVTKPDGTILRVNRTLCNWLNYEPDDLIGKLRFQTLLTVGSRLFHYTHWAPLLQMQGSVSEVQLEMLSASNRKTPILLNAITRNQGNETFHILAFFTSFDRSKYELELLSAKKTAEAALSERLEAEQALKKTEVQLTASNEQLNLADKRKDEFLATLAHELRNPLAPMRNVLEILKFKKFDDPQLEWSRDILDRQISHLTHLVDDLMEVSRITQGRVELKLTEFDISTAIQNAIESAQAAVNASGHQLMVIPSAEYLVVHADQTRVVQMILNLLNNAIKYTPHRGRITIKAEKLDDQVMISVKDTGIGIEAHKLKAVFEMFSQVDGALERSQGGLGIGLALVWGLAELHHGTVTAISKGLGSGSEFQLTLPLSKTKALLQDQKSQNTYTSGQGRRVLVIDDNEDITESLSTILALLGYEVKNVNGGLAGIEVASHFAPEIILLDIGLPGINGYEVARRIRNQPWGSKVTLIAATGWGQAQDVALALAAGFDSHLTKPIDFKELDQLLNPL